MRTTVTLDPDVEALLRKEMRRRGESFKRTLNQAIRDGLRGKRPRSTPPFRQPSFHMGAPRVDLTKALALAAELDDLDASAKLRAGR